MTNFVIKLPDIGEGVAEAEIVEWNVAVGDFVREDDTVVSVMSDKATVEIPSAVSGRVEKLGAEIGDSVAVGDMLLIIETTQVPDSEGSTESPSPPEDESATKEAQGAVVSETEPVKPGQPPASSGSGGEEKPLAGPSVRNRAREAGIDLRTVRGTGPAGRITREDLDSFIAKGSTRYPVNSAGPDNTVVEVKVTGLRRKIAERMALANQRIPHITIVEEVDMTDLEQLRHRMNDEKSDGPEKLTILPFVVRALNVAIRKHPAMNAHYDDDANVIRQFGAVHIGIATQTPSGLMVPVIRHCEANGIWAIAANMRQVCDRARSGDASRDELSGSTITITSLGALGALATTPIINHPEVAIVGINRLDIRPHWSGTEFVPRKMMNISCSFDHRVIDGWDAATFVQRLKGLLETPAMIFVESSR